MLFKQFSESWLNNEYHHDWLEAEGRRLLSFYKQARCDAGGFTALDNHGKHSENSQPDTMLTARMTHCFALASMQGEPGAGCLAEWGVSSLLGVLKDTQHGGWFGGLPHCNVKQRKLAYVHVFVTLAACSATLAGIQGADRLLNEATLILENHFWQPEEGALSESYSYNWQDPADYRGGNSNMHCTELFLQLADVTGEAKWRHRALSIAECVIHRHAPDNHYLLAEHFTQQWEVWADYNRDKPTDDFHPFGVTPGHSTEWARLLLHLEAALLQHGEAVPEWLLTDAKGLFHAGLAAGWNVEGSPGMIYTHDWDKQPVTYQRLHWTIAESCAAAASLLKRTGEKQYEQWYRTLWDYIGVYLIDPRHGSWRHELDKHNQPSSIVWEGKPDLYHAWQLTQICRLPLTPMIGLSIKQHSERR
ncbi:MAG: Sulfoquinovose isomerase [Candidatus Erwinia impunctatus]|nr:Sulfoquinovose isomerase [Culicoides impunctatus]